ncbi:BnaC01g43720D [Brassica napus]|uniref:BnaC01g43720D protein n=1 Tax=Brassica napus TaxID=3708 RepID=A0A078JAM3_BRANA|nr:BnaC01g43720D [Brassica napus]
MGNCLRHHNGFAGKEKDNLEPELPVELLEEGKGSSGEEGGSERSTQKESKVVRIKVVVTKGELRQILGHKKGTNSIQHLAHVLKDSGRNISRAYEEEEEQGDENWRPTLESIPENHY